MKNFYVKQSDYDILNSCPIIEHDLEINDFFMSLYNTAHLVPIKYIINQSIDRRVCDVVFFIKDDMDITEQNLQNVTFTSDLFIYKSTIKKLPDTLIVNWIVWADNLDYYPKHLIVKPLDSLPREAI
jgi:hypothetical protein